jgi:hypothetical protein
LSLIQQQPVTDRVWTLTSVHLDLVDVTLNLQMSRGIASNGSESSLASINFIKSRLMVETYSNQSRDIDLISQEILITDTRFQGTIKLFYLWVLHPVAHISNWFLVMPSIATEFSIRQLAFIFLLSHYMFRPLRAILR